MAATFDPTLATARDKARLALGDVAAPFLLQDETYDAVLYEDPLVDPPVELPMTAAYVRLARSCASVCLNKANEIQQGTMRRKWGDRYKGYLALATQWLGSGAPEDPEFTESVGVPQVVQIQGPNTDHLSLSTGLARPYPYCETPTVYFP